MERRELQAKSIHFRRQLMKDRRKAMYQNKYDRIKCIIAHSVFTQQTREIIEGRIKHIERSELA